MHTALKEANKFVPRFLILNLKSCKNLAWTSPPRLYTYPGQYCGEEIVLYNFHYDRLLKLVCTY